MEAPADERVQVRHPWDIRDAKLLAEQVAGNQGFSDVERDEIAIVISELGTNLVKHAGGGWIVVTSLFEEEHKGIQIETIDQGPGIADVSRAQTDGFSTVNSLGIGLGAVNRL